jgi:hypothetical protein
VVIVPPQIIIKIIIIIIIIAATITITKIMKNIGGGPEWSFAPRYLCMALCKCITSTD